MVANNRYVTNELEVGLPPLQFSRKAVWDAYRIEFLPNGYPGRRNHGILYAHPLYGAYVIADYHAQYLRTREEVFLIAAQRVANAALSLMTEIGGGGLAFMYDQVTTAVSARTEPFYSALTQARYLRELGKLDQTDGRGEFSEAVAAIMCSLTIPADRGGVARTMTNGGLILEEYSSEFPDCTLNGWTTATSLVHEHAASTNDEEAHALFAHSVKGLEALLPVYDVAELANSRYRLAGTASIQLRVSGGAIEICDWRTEVPHSGTYDRNITGHPSEESGRPPAKISPQERWTFTATLSRFSWPEPNRILLHVRAADNCWLQPSIGTGEYLPLSSRLKVQRYLELPPVPVAAGQSLVPITVPWARAELVSYPTNFGKLLAGRQFNQYHWIHVDTLEKIARARESAMLEYYRDRWQSYPRQWNYKREYQDPRITLERFNPRLHK